ncbi:hypothetical protein HDU98_012324, partial [Podochytrium sp. JEL0797]
MSHLYPAQLLFSPDRHTKSPSHTRIHGSTSTAASLNGQPSDRVFRRPTGGSFVGINSSATSFHELSQSLPPPHPFPPPRKFTSGMRAGGVGTRLRNSSLVQFEECDGEEAENGCVKTVPGGGTVGSACSDAASIVNSIVASVRNIGLEVGGKCASRDVGEEKVKDAERGVMRESMSSLFKRPLLNARVSEDRDFLKVNDESLHTAWSADAAKGSFNPSEYVILQ